MEISPLKQQHLEQARNMHFLWTHTHTHPIENAYAHLCSLERMPILLLKPTRNYTLIRMNLHTTDYWFTQEGITTIAALFDRIGIYFKKSQSENYQVTRRYAWCNRVTKERHVAEQYAQQLYHYATEPRYVTTDKTHFPQPLYRTGFVVSHHPKPKKD